jgi:dihydroorotase-like cyclic amidohydrolase
MVMNDKYQKHGFDLPEDYFKTSEARLKQLSLKHKPSATKKSIIRVHRLFWLPAAASTALLFWWALAGPESATMSTDRFNGAHSFENKELIDAQDPWVQYAEDYLGTEDFLAMLHAEDLEILMNEATEWEALDQQAIPNDYLIEESHLILNTL